MTKKILIVDDDNDVVDAMTMVLEGHGYQVVSTQTASNALETAKKEKPDLILLDVMFPEDTTKGFELSRIFHNDEAVKGTPVVILSAINIKFKLGFSGKHIDDDWMPVKKFIEKPVEPEKLIATVKELIG